jgi:type IV pilus assembly protein PilV
MLGIQLKSMVDNQNANQRVIAARLADDLFERMKSNTGGVANINGYVIGVNLWPATNPQPASQSRCDLVFCTPGNQAAFDLWQWRERVGTMLTGGRASTFISPSDSRQLGVMIAWPIRKTDAAKTSAGDAVDTAKTNFRYGWLNVDVPNGATCPTDMVCHVAYSQP